MTNPTPKQADGAKSAEERQAEPPNHCQGCGAWGTSPVHLCGCKAEGGVDEAKLAAAMYQVESVHHFHGADCLCGFSSHRSRSRTEHITGALANELRSGGR